MDYIIHWNRKVAIVCSLKYIEVQEGPECTCQAETVIGTSFTTRPSAAIFVHPNRTVHPIVDCLEFTSSQFDTSKSKPYYL